MKPQEKKKMLFFLARNLAFYLLVTSFIYIGASYERHAIGYRPYLIFTSFYLWTIFHNTVLFEKLLLRRKYLSYAVCFIGALLIVSFLQRSIPRSPERNAEGWIYVVVLNCMYSVVGLICYLAFKYVMERKSFYQLKIMQRDIELQQLRAHLNPHFLFNALNNIYSYTLQHNRFGGELIIKLSELMRFILDSSDKKHIQLKDELGFIHNYIVFEKERLGERCSIHFTETGDRGARMITPLILFPFIENACKYGADTIQRTDIDILIEHLPHSLKMTVKNNIVNRASPSTKTGLQNAVRRLELLYPDKHEVLITTDDSRFSVELILYYHED